MFELKKLKSYKYIYQLLKQIDDYYPFTLTGTVLFITAVWFLANSLLYKDAYVFLLSLISLIVLSLFAVLGRWQAQSLQKCTVGWNSPPDLKARKNKAWGRIVIPDARVFFFFRIHCLLQGKLQVGKNSNVYVRFETAEHNAQKLNINYQFPFCGDFLGTGTCHVKDILSLTRNRFAGYYNCHLRVQPAELKEKISITLQTPEGIEESQQKKAVDDEKYYMREYIPGDRFRDINWKATSRLQELITRISPFSQQKSKILYIFFRPFWSEKKENALTVAHLNYLKSWLLATLKYIWTEHTDFQFHLQCGNKVFQIIDEEDLANFASYLSTLCFTSEYTTWQDAQVPKEMIIFTSPFDKMFPGFMTSLSQTKIHLFHTSFKAKAKNSMTLDYAFFSGFNLDIFPGLWFFSNNIMNHNGSVPAIKGIVEERVLKVNQVKLNFKAE